jgi:hypothetical protein
MKSPILYYAVIALGVIALVIGGVYQSHVLGDHHTRALGFFVLGAVFVVVGVVGMFVMKPKASA